jgi:hypothetical protein
MEISPKLLKAFMEIKKEKCRYINNKEPIRKNILPDEIEGISTFYISITNTQYKHEIKNGFLSIFILFNGDVSIRQNQSTVSTNEVTVYVPSGTEEFFFVAEKGKIELLEIELKISDNDLLYLKKNKDKFPFFGTYSNCRYYKDEIKSDKTINRMILPENIVPRLCIGSVETTGPDKVSEHKHPMLEQLFLGLAHNRCLVKAGNQATILEEYELLHIPLGSLHGAEVNENQFLHYMWIDCFKSQNDTR